MKSKFYLVGLILALFVFALPKQEAKAQVKELLNSSYNVTSDTVVNTATAVLRLQIKSGLSPVTVIARVLEISGTTGGTLTLVGSMDGTNWRALTTEETATAMATYTPADAATAQLFM